MAEISQVEWDEHKRKTNEIHSALIGDSYGNKGYKHRIGVLEEHMEASKKREWKQAGIIIGLSTAWAAIVKFWDKIF